MAEPTVGQCAPTVNEKLDDGPLVPLACESTDRFIARGEWWAVPDLLRRMHWSAETWIAWRAAGLRTQIPRTKVEHVLTDWLIDFWTSHPEYDTKPPKVKGE